MNVLKILEELEASLTLDDVESHPYGWGNYSRIKSNRVRSFRSHPYGWGNYVEAVRL